MEDLSFRDKRRRQSIEHLDRAERVLTALTQHQKPEAEDLAALRDFAPAAAGKSIGELACEVIRNALNHAMLSSTTAEY